MPTVQTRYMEMLLHLDEIPRVYNILAAALTWILLAGFLVIPGTFTSFNKDTGNNGNKVEQAVVHSIQHIGLLWLAGIFCIVGGFGCMVLWFRWFQNYVWLINRIFLYTLPLPSPLAHP